MVLGESVYCGDQCKPCDGCPLFTIECIQKYLKDDVYDQSGNYQGWANTYKKFEASLIGRKLTIEERPLVWDSIVFYIYFQTALDKARQPLGGDLEYDRAAECLMKTLQQVQPEGIIVWGNRLWECLPSENWTNIPNIVNDERISNTGFYTISGVKYPFMLVNHPSSGYSWDVWHKNIKDFLDNL